MRLGPLARPGSLAALQQPLRRRAAGAGHHDFEAGGNFLDWGAHTVDLCQWANQADHTMPIEYEATPNSIVARYANGVKTRSATSCPPPFGDRSPQYRTSTGTCPVRFEGDEGWVETGDNGEIVLSPNLTKTLRRSLPAPALSSAGHGRNFFDCVRSRAKPVCNQDIMRRSHIACFAAQLSWQLGRKLTLDPVKEEFVDDDGGQPHAASRDARAVVLQHLIPPSDRVPSRVWLCWCRRFCCPPGSRRPTPMSRV